ncbi:hypothetical protein [Spiroplasma endosymbiont of Danaus chrysippus]|uniref:hypothetical protein n=1 Tax=Spiroplasma endosymbiont of Danaus chrysippus TaxID=2691041 RepID=UPI00157B242E|nr:hypothetical protein [Spiroplasma endosymbiont of Danaus chrysippus]
MQQKYWWKLQKGMGIRVKIIDDTDKETGKQKYRPAIVIKSYPSHVKVQLMTTEPSNHDYFQTKIDNQIQYIRSIYYRTIKFNEITDIWKDKFNKIISINKTSKLFQKIVEMKCKEIFEINIDLEKNKYQEKEIQELKKQICVQALKLKNRNRG